MDITGDHAELLSAPLGASDLHGEDPDPVRAPKPKSAGYVGPGRGLVRFLYSSNPFYIISAEFVFIGLRMSFSTGPKSPRTDALLCGLALCAFILAVTACVLIRIGKLWDDLRSLLLLIVICFFAMAIFGDDAMASDPGRGTMIAIGSFLFALVLTETVLGVIGLRMPGWYRVAYYLILALVFLYPIALAPLLSDPESAGLRWALFGFSPLAALALLALAPAAYRGAAYVAENGSPWRWPLYPWSLFLIMALGLAVRCSSLCVSFHFVEGRNSIYGSYFLIPIGFAVCVVWLEIGIASGRRGVMWAASAAPLGLAALAMSGHRYDPVYQSFLTLFMKTLGGSPAYFSLLAAIGFQFYAAARGVRGAWALMTIGLTALSVVGPRTIEAIDLVSLRWLPLVAAGTVLGAIAWHRRASGRALVAAMLLVLGLGRASEVFWPRVDSIAVVGHLAIVGLLVVGAVFDDTFARRIRTAGAAVLLLLGLISAAGYSGPARSLPAGVATFYPIMIAAGAAAYGLMVRDRMYLEGAWVTLAAWLGKAGWQGYGHLRRGLVGLDQIVCGLLFFAIALAISLKKAGVPVELLSRPVWRLAEAYVRRYSEPRET
jgi:hypothetical protein